MSNDPKIAVQSRLRAFFEAVYEEAQQNPQFLTKLEEILVSRDLRISPIKKCKNEGITQKAINIVDVLHTEGEDGLKIALTNFTNSDLIKLCTQEGIRKIRDSKNHERDELIVILIQTASDRLRQGESFTKKG